MTMQGAPIELSALEALGVDYLPNPPRDHGGHLDNIRAFFMPWKNDPRILGDLLPDRVAWFRKYAAPYLTRESAENLSNFIDRLADNERYIDAEIRAYMKRNKLDALTFGDFVRSFDENGAATKSIISSVLRNAAKKRGMDENPTAKKSRKRS